MIDLNLFLTSQLNYNKWISINHKFNFFKSSDNHLRQANMKKKIKLLSKINSFLQNY